MNTQKVERRDKHLAKLEKSNDKINYSVLVLQQHVNTIDTILNNIEHKLNESKEK